LLPRPDTHGNKDLRPLMAFEEAEKLIASDEADDVMALEESEMVELTSAEAPVLDARADNTAFSGRSDSVLASQTGAYARFMHALTTPNTTETKPDLVGQNAAVGLLEKWTGKDIDGDGAIGQKLAIDQQQIFLRSRSHESIRDAESIFARGVAAMNRVKCCSSVDSWIQENGDLLLDDWVDEETYAPVMLCQDRTRLRTWNSFQGDLKKENESHARYDFKFIWGCLQLCIHTVLVMLVQLRKGSRTRLVLLPCPTAFSVLMLTLICC
jgi:hypothetical protein